LEGVDDLETVGEFGGEQVEQLAVGDHVQLHVADARGQPCARVLVGLRQDLVLEVVEVDSAFAVLVDDAFE